MAQPRKMLGWIGAARRPRSSRAFEHGSSRIANRPRECASDAAAACFTGFEVGCLLDQSRQVLLVTCEVARLSVSPMIGVIAWKGSRNARELSGFGYRPWIHGQPRPAHDLHPTLRYHDD